MTTPLDLHLDDPAERADLAAAYALDALSPAETEAVEALLQTDADLAAQVAEFQTTVALLAEVAAEVTVAADDAFAVSPAAPVLPPATLRERVLTNALGVRSDTHSQAPGRESVASPTEALARTAGAFLATAEQLTDAEWAARTDLGLTAGDVVAHLTAAFDYVAGTVGATAPGETAPPPVPPGPDVAHVSYTRPAVDAARLEARPAVLRRAQASLGRLVDWAVTATPTQLGDTVAYEGGEVPAFIPLVARAFESWAHGEHVRRAVGHEPLELSGGELALLCDVAVGVIPTTYGRAGHQPSGRWLRLVLTGPGGGTWNVGDDNGSSSGGGMGPATASVIMESVDLCRVTGGLLDVGAAFTSVSGDDAFARELLGSLAVLAE